MRVREGRKERREYFYDLLNFRDDLEAELSCPWRGGLENERRRWLGAGRNHKSMQASMH